MHLETLVKVNPNTTLLGEKRTGVYSFVDADKKTIAADNGVIFGLILPQQRYFGPDQSSDQQSIAKRNAIRQAWSDNGVLYSYPFTTPYIEFYDPIDETYKTARFGVDAVELTWPKKRLQLYAERSNGDKYILEAREVIDAGFTYDLYLGAGVFYNWIEDKFDLFIKITTACESYNNLNSSRPRIYMPEAICFGSDTAYSNTGIQVYNSMRFGSNTSMGVKENFNRTYNEYYVSGRTDPWGTAYYRRQGQTIGYDDQINLLGFLVKAPSNFIAKTQTSNAAYAPSCYSVTHDVDI